ncbi:Gfo/Idh/MocA family protein [Pseudomonadota bacterium]
MFEKDRCSVIAKTHDIEAHTTDLDAALNEPEFPVFFDAAATHMRASILQRALAAGKHIYAEKPVASTVEIGLSLLADAEKKGLKHGVVEDKLHLPGFLKLGKLVSDGFFGEIVGFKLEFGWWIFDGISTPAQRSSWNYKRATGGGLLSDMYPHWRYVIEGLLGPIDRVISVTSTAQSKRVDEAGASFDVDVEDTAHTLVELKSGAVGTILSSWASRVRQEDLLTLKIDGTAGSAVAGLHKCHTQSSVETPLIGSFNLGKDDGGEAAQINYFDHWQEVSAAIPYKNPYRYGWENFLAHVVADAPFHSKLSQGIRDVQLSEACLESVREEKWIDMTDRTGGSK